MEKYSSGPVNRDFAYMFFTDVELGWLGIKIYNAQHS